MLRSLAAAATLAAALGSGLLDAPIAGDVEVRLDSASGIAAWLVSNGTITLPARVPGDLLTDLQLGGVIGDPLYELNFKQINADGVPPWDTKAPWTYTTTFDVPPGFASWWLVLDGVKMVADVQLNGVPLGYTADQFLRYNYDVTAHVKPTGNVLSLTFTDSSDDRLDEERWMSCSGAPYSTTNHHGAQTFSKGIWKSVYMVGSRAGSAALAFVAPRTYYNGPYPTAPLDDGAHSGFTVNVTVHLAALGATSGTLSASGGWGAAASAPVALAAAGTAAFVLSLPAAAADIKLWWPAQSPGGRGQPRYAVNVSYTPSGGGAAVTDSRMIGFRVLYLVTGNDTDPSTLAGVDGSGDFTMRFAVNGARIWTRGANMIPMNEMEGRDTAAAHRRLVQSAAEGGFNIFRLWGGGIYQYDAWYDAADEFGLLIYHDAMYAQGNHAPASTPMQLAELQYQIRRLASHPSIAVFDSCNECNGHGIYASFVMTTIVGEDTSRPAWPSCPASGWKSGVDRLTGLPNGSPLGLQPNARPPKPSPQPQTCAAGTCATQPSRDYDQGTMWIVTQAADLQACCDACTAGAPQGCFCATLSGTSCYWKNKTQCSLPEYGVGVTSVWPAGSGPPPPAPTPGKGCDMSLLPFHETHGYYQHGEGFKTVNSGADLQPFDPNVPPKMPPIYAGGNGCPGTYASEFGSVSSSSFESMSATLDSSHWGANSPPMSERNYALNNLITSYTNIPSPAAFTNASGIDVFRKQLFWAQLGPAIWVKSDIEARRAQNTWGTITWQFNEIWPTGGWGSIEYGTVGYTAGQVEGGRWKPLQYFMRRFIYNDRLIAAASDGRLLVKNDDAFAPLNASARVSLLHLASGAVTPLSASPVSLPVGAGAAASLCVDPAGACAGWPALLPAAGCAAAGGDCIALLELRDAASGALLAENFELLASPASMTFPSAAAVALAAAVGEPDAAGEVPITLSCQATALFVTLTTLAQGRFSDNAIILPGPGNATINFVPWGPLDLALLKSSLRVEHLALYGVS